MAMCGRRMTSVSCRIASCCRLSTTDNRQIASDGCFITSVSRQMTSAGPFMAAATGKIAENIWFLRNSRRMNPIEVKSTTAFRSHPVALFKETTAQGIFVGSPFGSAGLHHRELGSTVVADTGPSVPLAGPGHAPPARSNRSRADTNLELPSNMPVAILL